MGDDEPGEYESGIGGRESDTELSAREALSTVGTGSVLGIGCLVVVVLLIVIAIAIRWFGGSW